MPLAHDGIEEHIEDALTAGLPVVVVLEITDQFENPAPDGEIDVPPLTAPVNDYHAVTAVAAATNATGTARRLLIRNSWGPGWAAGGYGWLPYDYLVAFAGTGGRHRSYDAGDPMTTDPPTPKADPMDLTTYQERAGSTDILTKDDPLMPLLGLAGEVGQLIAEYKKRQRDVHGYRAFKDEVREELGDILWYAAALARHNGLDLGDIAQRNLAKTHDLFRSGGALPAQELFDAGLTLDQRFPHRLTVTLVENEETSKRGERLLRVRMYAGDAAVGIHSMTTPNTMTPTAITTSSTWPIWPCSAGRR